MGKIISIHSCSIENRTQQQDEIFKVIHVTNLQVSVAWWLREEFKEVVECKTLSDAKQHFRRWSALVNEAVVKEIMQVALMFEQHLTGECNAFRLNNPTLDLS